MKLEVDMYIRSPKGKIEKIDCLVEQDNPIFPYTINCTARFRSDIAKASHNIIDLIEEKDFCEIEFYSPRYDKRVTRIFQVDYIVEDNICFENGHCQLNILHAEWSNQDKKLNPIIKRILTHEQFEREAYKV